MNEGLDPRTIAIDDSIGMSDQELTLAAKQINDYDRRARQGGRYAECSFRRQVKAHVTESFAKARRHFRDRITSKRGQPSHALPCRQGDSRAARVKGAEKGV